MFVCCGTKFCLTENVNKSNIHFVIFFIDKKLQIKEQVHFFDKNLFNNLRPFNFTINFLHTEKINLMEY